MKYIHFWCVAIISLLLSNELQAATVVWSGASGTDTNWSDTANWSGGAVPGGGDDAKFFDAGSVTFPNTNNVVDANLTIGSLQYGNTNNSHTTLIANGVTLTITNTGGLIAATLGDIIVMKFLTNTIAGAQGTLNVTNPNATISVSYGGANGSSSEILNMTKLATFTASINRMGIGTTTSFNPAGSNNKLAGILYLAQTNVIALGLTDTLANYQTSGTRTNSIEIARNPNNNGGVPSFLYLGQTNIIFLDSIDTGMGKQSGSSTWGWMGFNPAFINSVAYFRGVSGGSSRVTWWCVGDGTSVGSSSNGGVGTNDFSNGSVDAMINVLSLGRDTTASDTFGGPHRGVLTFNSGTIDVNTAIVGNQSLETGTSTTPSLGVVNVGSAALFRVNTGMTLGFTTLTTAAGTGTSGNLNVNGGTVYANNIMVGTSSSANIIRLTNATLIVTNAIATNASSLSFITTNSTIGLSVPSDGSLRCLTKTLTTGGATNRILLDSKPVFFASYPQQFPLIKFTTWTGINNFGLTNVPAWAPGATLFSNGPNSSLDLSLPTNPRPVFTSQPSPYSGNPGDNVTTSFAVTIAAGSVTPLGYQWYYTNGVNTNLLSNGPGPSGLSTLSGATSANLQIANAQPGDDGSYFVVVTNAFGTNSSSLALLTISAGAVPPTASGPATLTTTNGANTAIVDSASGSPVPVLYWQYNGSPLVNGSGPSGSSTISGASTSTLTISNPRYPGDQGTYSLIASNIAGMTTNNTVLTVIVPPVITLQPTNVVVTNTQAASFSVQAGGVPAVAYQWEKNGLPMSDNSNVSGSSSSNLSFIAVSPSDIATYSCTITNLVGSTNSASVTLTVNSTMGYASLKPGNGATGVCYDTPLYINFTVTPKMRAAGKIRIYNATNAITPVDTIDLSLCVNNDPTYAINVQAYVIGGDTLTNFPVIISGTTAAIYPHQGLLASNQTYYVTLDDGTFTDSTGAYFAGITDTNAWRFTTKPTGPANSTNLVVAQDYSGDFATVQGAVMSVASGSTTPTFINVRNGTYTELVNIKSRNNVDIRGQSRNGTTIGYPNNNNVFGGAPQRAAFIINGNDCTLENLTLTNMTVVGGGQAEAVDVEGTRAIFYNMELDSYQDTFLVHSAGKLVYFQDSLIQGQTDFNWGYGTVYYTNCEVRCVLSGGHVTQPRSPATTNGFGFINCRITQGYSGSSTFDLGRTIGTPSSPSEVLYYNCLMADVVTGYASDAGVNMADYGTSNLTATATKTLAFSTHSSSSDPYVIAIQSAPTWLYGWQPQVAPNITSQPSGQSINYGSGSATFTVVATGVPAPAYQWLKNGASLSGATNSTLTRAGAVSDSGNYSVVVTTSAGSVTSSPAALIVNPATLTVTANNTNKGYGQTLTFAGTEFTAAGLVAGDSVSSVTLNSSGAVGTAVTGSYDIVPSAAAGVGLGNYNINYSNGTLMVNQANTFVGASSSENPSGYKDAVSFLATLPADASGSVVFSSTNGAFSTNALSSGSATSLNLINLPRGTNVITFAYAGDVNYLGSTNMLNQIVTNHPPVANNVSYTRNAAVNTFKVLVSDLLTNATDADGDSLSLASVSSTTNNALIAIAGGYVTYSNTNAVSDQFTYAVSDGYGGINSAVVSIAIDTTPLFGQSQITASDGTATLSFEGIPGYSYSVSRSVDLLGGWTVIWTTNAPAGGTFEFIDTSAPSPTAFYWLQYNNP